MSDTGAPMRATFRIWQLSENFSRVQPVGTDITDTGNLTWLRNDEVGWWTHPHTCGLEIVTASIPKSVLLQHPRLTNGDENE